MAAMAVALAVGGIVPAFANHDDPNCEVTVHQAPVGQVKVFVGCEHGRGDRGGGGGH